MILTKTKDKNFNLCLALVASYIPWYKMQNPQFRTFLEKYTEKTSSIMYKLSWAVLP